MSKDSLATRKTDLFCVTGGCPAAERATYRVPVPPTMWPAGVVVPPAWEELEPVDRRRVVLMMAGPPEGWASPL